MYRANELDENVLADTKDFLIKLNKDKLMNDHSAGLKAELNQVKEQNRKAENEISQKEKELQKLKDEIVKVLMGESQFPQNVLTELIQQRERELAEYAKRCEAVEKAALDLKNQIKLSKAVQNNYKSWAERFDSLTIQEKRAMLIDIIDRIKVYPKKIQIRYKVTIDQFDGTAALKSGGDETSPSDFSFYPEQFVKPAISTRRYSTGR